MLENLWISESSFDILEKFKHNWALSNIKYNCTVLSFAYCHTKNWVNCVISLVWTFLADTCAADVVFVVDESGSIGLSNYNNLKDYIRDVVNLLTPTERGHHIGLVSFSNNARLHFKFEYSNLPSKVRISCETYILETRYIVLNLVLYSREILIQFYINFL